MVTDFFATTNCDFLANVTGGAEPFFSKTMMRFMREFDASKFPKLKKIHLHTNGTLWNENAWKAITPVHKYISTCEISMDAGTREVYNIVRLGGDWDKLMNNIDFVLTIPTIKIKKTIFCNYYIIAIFI